MKRLRLLLSLSCLLASPALLASDWSCKSASGEVSLSITVERWVYVDMVTYRGQYYAEVPSCSQPHGDSDACHYGANGDNGSPLRFEVRLDPRTVLTFAASRDNARPEQASGTVTIKSWASAPPATQTEDLSCSVQN